MNKKSKKSIIVVLGVVLVLSIFICLLFLDGNKKEKIINCNMTLTSENLFNLEMQMKVKYIDYVDSVEGKIYYKFLTDESKNNIDIFIDSLNNSYSGLKSISVKATKQNDMLVVNYFIDYNIVNKKELETFGFDFGDNESLKITKDEFEQQIIEGGGSCVEE